MATTDRPGFPESPVAPLASRQGIAYRCRGRMTRARAMIISQPAAELAAQYGDRAASRLSRVLGRLGLQTTRRSAVTFTFDSVAADVTTSHAVMVAAPDEPVVELVEPLARPVEQPASYRRARAALLRGMLLARKGNYLAATDAFSEALDLDPTVDLAGDAEIWTLPRGGLDAAVEAYERVGRLREAARLATLIRRRLTPRVVPPAPA